jgi:hypothetical protein
VCDVYVTFRRSLDPSLTLFRRFWTNGIRGAEIVVQAAVPRPALVPQATTTVNPSAITFKAADFVGASGQTVQIPITAAIAGDYPLRLLMLNLTVEPVDGSPALTVPVQFTPNPALGLPDQTLSIGNGNYAGVWLDSTIAGLTGNATLGTLSFTLPANAAGTAAYVINFEHASASPNGLASFPEHTINGVVSLADRSVSSFGDGIPDSWRLRYFGTVYNQLSQAAADADGDGADNAQEYGAGTDPLDAKSCLKLAMSSENGSGIIRWPSIYGKQYVIEYSGTLFGTNWTPIGTVAGTGAQLQFQDNSGNGSRFYRTHVLP